MSGQADIVKKNSLKLKVVKSKTGGAVLQGPKIFREFWFVFRALIGGEKILEYHQNERKFQESGAYPKGVLHLGTALAVSYHNPERKQQFSIELAGGSLIFLEAASETIAREWMTCLNAVLFGKGNGPHGALEYFAEVPVGSRLQYAGRCLLEVKDEELTVKTSDGTANLVRWKLAHIRSFKAKKDTLTIFSGSRSATGVGEYMFRTPQSVQITHAIETVVKKLKYEALGSSQQELIPQHTMAHSVSAPGIVRSRPFISERRPLPPPPPPSHPAPSPTITPPRTPSPSEVSSVESSMAAVPDHIPCELIPESEDHTHSRNRKYIPPFRPPEYSTEYSTVGDEEPYQRLDHRLKQRSASPPKGYSRLSHQNAPAIPERNRERSRSGSRSPTPQGHTPSEDYGRLDHRLPLPPVEGEEYEKLDLRGQDGGSNIAGEDYGKLDLGAVVTGGTLDHREGEGECEEGYSMLKVPSPILPRKAPPPVPLPYKPRSGSPLPEIIRQLNQNEGGEGGEVYSEVAPSVPSVGVSEGYGRLNHSLHPTHTVTPSPDPPPHSSQLPGYSRLGATPKAPPTIDPYASLSDARIQDLSDALRKEDIGVGGGGDYSKLGVVTPPPNSTHQVDSLGYSKPWNSFATAINTTPAPNSTPKPSLNEIRTEPHQNGTETAPEGDAEFEALYDRAEATPPAPPPRRGSLSRHSRSPPVASSKPGKPALPPRPHRQ